MMPGWRSSIATTSPSNASPSCGMGLALPELAVLGKVQRMRRPIKARPSSRPGLGSAHISIVLDVWEVAVPLSAPLSLISFMLPELFSVLSPDGYRRATTHPARTRKGLGRFLLFFFFFVGISLPTQFPLLLETAIAS